MSEFRFHLFAGPHTTVESAQEAAAGAVRHLGLVASHRGVGALSCRLGGTSHVFIDLDSRSDVTEVLVHGLKEQVFAEGGASAVRNVLVAISDSLDGQLGRSYGDTLQTSLHRSELTTGVQALHWFQYFGPARAPAMMGKLSNAPIHQWGTTPKGAVWFDLAETPFVTMMSIREAAAALGIKLRPLVGKDMNGQPVEFNWP